MRSRTLAIIGAAWALAAAGPAGSTAGVAKLGWLSGDWISRNGDSWVEERWTGADGGMMLGTTRHGRGERVASFEFMRIAESGAVVTFWGSPEGKAAVGFRLTRAGTSDAVFENPAHDFPTRISYRRTGDQLTATISGPGGSGEQRWVYRRR